MDRSDLWKGKPVKALTEGLSQKGGRNSDGRITMRHRGGGHKRRYRKIDFKRRKFNVPATVERLEYDPNRSAFIALVRYEDGEQAYILAPQRVSPGDKVVSGDRCDIKPGNAMPMSNIPVGTIIHNVEMKPGKGGQIARSAGNYVQLVGKDQGYALLRLPSGEQRMVHARCMATIGAVSNPDNQNTNQGKAGRMRWRGRRPSVRGVAMNPVDHPHGGGEGKSSGGRHPVHPLGRADQGQAHAEQQENRPLHHAASGQEIGRGTVNGAFRMEGPLRRRLSSQEGRAGAGERPQGYHPYLVAAVHDPAAVRGPHLWCLQRAQVSAGAGQREHGRPQVRRVFADAGLPRPCRRQESAAGLTMGKLARPRRLGETEAQAKIRNLRISPQKLGLVTAAIRGRPVDEALITLANSRRRIAGDVRKCLQSAIANAENNHELDVDRLVVAEATVGKGLVMKRWRPRARGRTGRVIKPFSHLTIVVRERAKGA